MRQEGAPEGAPPEEGVNEGGQLGRAKPELQWKEEEGERKEGWMSAFFAFFILAWCAQQNMMTAGHRFESI